MLTASLSKSLPLQKMVTIVMGIGIMILGSKVQIPLRPVPVTLQTAGMLFIAMTSSPSKVFLSLFLWLSMAGFGLPVLASNVANIQSLIGNTSGYLWGMLLAGTLMSLCQFYGADFFNRLFSKKNFEPGASLSMPAMMLVSYLGSIIVLGLGWASLCRYLTPAHAWSVGVAPFLVGDFLKITMMSGIISVFQWGKIRK